MASTKAFIVGDLSLLVSSCDAYADLWTPCFNLLRRHWPGCPLKQYLLSNDKRFGDPDVVSLCVGRLGSWSDEIIAALSRIETPYVLVMLDDFFLRGPVSEASIFHCLKFAQERGAVCVRLVPKPGPTHRLAGEDLIGLCDPELPYRINTQASIWDRRALLGLLRSGESIWEFEHNANARNRGRCDGFFSAKDPVFPYCGVFSHHVVEKGKWLPPEKCIFRRMAIGCDFDARAILNWQEVTFYYLVSALERTLSLLPWRTKLIVKRVIKRIGSTFFQRQIDRLAGVKVSNGGNR